MAAPTQPTLITICTEALNRAGYSSPDSTLLTRAEDHFMEKVKHDIWKKAKKLKSLQTTRTYAITEGLGLIDLDSDFSSFLSMQLLSCTHFGVCQAGGSTTTAILASDEDMDSDYPIGKELVIYLTATKTTAYSGYITGWDTSTKVATIAPAWTPSPDTTYSYMVVDCYRPIAENHIVSLDMMYQYLQRGIPLAYYPLGDVDYGQYLLYPTPYFADGNPYAIRERYYANLLTIDLAGTLMTTLYRRWRGELEDGVLAYALQDMDDDRQTGAMQNYYANLNMLAAREEYGMDLSNLMSRIE